MKTTKKSSKKNPSINWIHQKNQIHLKSTLLYVNPHDNTSPTEKIPDSVDNISKHIIIPIVALVAITRLPEKIPNRTL